MFCSKALSDNKNRNNVSGRGYRTDMQNRIYQLQWLSTGPEYPPVLVRQGRGGVEDDKE